MPLACFGEQCFEDRQRLTKTRRLSISVVNSGRNAVSRGRSSARCTIRRSGRRTSRVSAKLRSALRWSHPSSGILNHAMRSKACSCVYASSSAQAVFPPPGIPWSSIPGEPERGASAALARAMTAVRPMNWARCCGNPIRFSLLSGLARAPSGAARVSRVADAPSRAGVATDSAGKGGSIGASS